MHSYCNRGNTDVITVSVDDGVSTTDDSAFLTANNFGGGVRPTAKCPSMNTTLMLNHKTLTWSSDMLRWKRNLGQIDLLTWIGFPVPDK
jgi:hypothetical protein